MLSDGELTATVAVKDLAAGKKFYGETLGLKQVDENPGGIMLGSASGKIFVYQSDTAGSGRATCANWHVDDISSAVAELKGKGITFEHYDMPGATMDGDVHVMGGIKAAWFKDPDGNILSVASD